LVHNVGWCDALKDLWAIPGALHKAAKAAGLLKPLIHAHHIVMKEAIYDSTKKAQAILAKYGIDLLDGNSKRALATGLSTAAARIKALAKIGDPLDNLCWAIRNADFYGPHGLHSEVAQNEVYELLKAAVKEGGTHTQIRARLQDALHKMRRSLEKGEGFW
jgi:hypothetical protein